MSGSNAIVTPHWSVLVVDDEEHVRTSISRVLERDGYAVTTAESGEEALSLLEGRDVQVLISDNNMPGISGLELFKKVRLTHPRVVRIMLTGDEDPDLAVRSINEGEVYRFIRKPWNNQDLRTIVRLALDVAVLEDEKRKLLEIVRRHRATKGAGQSVSDEEAELLLLAEADLLGN